MCTQCNRVFDCMVFDWVSVVFILRYCKVAHYTEVNCKLNSFYAIVHHKTIILCICTRIFFVASFFSHTFSQSHTFKLLFVSRIHNFFCFISVAMCAQSKLRSKFIQFHSIFQHILSFIFFFFLLFDKQYQILYRIIITKSITRKLLWNEIQ